MCNADMGWITLLFHYGQFLYVRGSIKYLFVNNVNISVEQDAPLFGRGAFSCVDDDHAVIGEALISNLSINAEKTTRYDVAFQGNWRRLHIVNACIEADTVYDITEHPEAYVQETNTKRFPGPRACSAALLLSRRGVVDR